MYRYDKASYDILQLQMNFRVQNRRNPYWMLLMMCAEDERPNFLRTRLQFYWEVFVFICISECVSGYFKVVHFVYLSQVSILGLVKLANISMSIKNELMRPNSASVEHSIYAKSGPSPLLTLPQSDRLFTWWCFSPVLVRSCPCRLVAVICFAILFQQITDY